VTGTFQDVTEENDERLLLNIRRLVLPVIDVSVHQLLYFFLFNPFIPVTFFLHFVPALSTETFLQDKNVAPQIREVVHTIDNRFHFGDAELNIAQ
jgi:hypothetical protein